MVLGSAVQFIGLCSSVECRLALENNQYTNNFTVNMDVRKHIEKRLKQGEILIGHHFPPADLFTVGLTCPNSANIQYNINIICAE